MNHSAWRSVPRSDPSPAKRTSRLDSRPVTLPKESLVAVRAKRAVALEERATYGRSARGVRPSSPTGANQRVAATSTVCARPFAEYS